MRLVTVTVPAGKRAVVLETLDDEGVDYVVTDETSGREYEAIVFFPLPAEAVEPVLDALRSAGLNDQAFTVVQEARTVLSEHFEELQERYHEDENEERIAREELTAAASDLAPTTPTFVVMIVISAVIATAGLLLDSPAVVVGSMVIAPLIGPAMAASVGTVVDDQALFRRGVRLQILGMFLAVASATAFAFGVKTLHLVPPGIDVTAIAEVRERLTPDFLSLAVALGSGVAGVYSLASGVSSALVGVMIAAALMPPAATVGIGLAWGTPVASLGSAVLALVNGLSINLAALVTLWYTGYRPERWFRLDQARSTTLYRVAVLAAAVAVLSVFLGGVTLVSFERATFEQDAQSAVEATLEEPAYDGVVVLGFDAEFGDAALTRTPGEVVVTVGVPPGEPPADLASVFAERIETATGEEVDVQVRIVEVSRAR